MKRYAILTLLLGSLQGEATHAQAFIGGDWRADVDRFAEQLVEMGSVAGMGIAIVHGDWIIYTRGVGQADAETGRAVGADTYFYIASSSKALTATAASLKAARGELDLDAPVVKNLPELQDTAWDEEGVTLHELLAMKHGMADGGPVVFRTAFSGEFSRSKLLALLGEYRPSGDGKVFDYGNLGYNMLGLVMSDRETAGWKDAVSSEVLEPLGMSETTAYLSRIDPDRIAMPHTVSTVPTTRVPLAKTDANLHAAGGHFTTARSLARFVAAHLTGGTVSGNRLLPGQPLLLTHKKQVEQDREFGEYRRVGWGYGWDLGKYNGESLIHRFGGFLGYRSHMSFMPEHDVGVVVLANTVTPGVDLMANYIYARLLEGGEIDERFNGKANELKKEDAEFRKRNAERLAERANRKAPLPRPLKAYTGVYRNSALGTMEWREIAGGLEVRIGVVHSRAEVFDASKDALRYEVAGRGGVAEFKFDAGQSAASAIIVQDREFKRIKR